MIGHSLGYVVVYVLLVGVASFVESPVGRGLDAFQLNMLIRTGSLCAAVVALVAAHGLAVPAAGPALAGLGIGLLAGVGSFFYCFALDYLPVSVVVTFANLYLAVTTLLGIVVLGEPVTAVEISGLACTLAGVVLLAHTPARYGVDPSAAVAERARPRRALLIMAVYVAIVGVTAFLEKPALRHLDATQLNGLMAIAMTAVAAVAVAAKGPPPPMTRRTLAGLAVGATIGIASVFYFLGLQGLPVSIAAALSNASIVVTILLSSVFLRQPLTRERVAAIALTLLGVTLLALAA